MRPADEPGAADQRPGAVDVADDALAQRLVRPVVRPEVFAVRLEPGHRRVLHLGFGGRLARVDRHGGDEHVAPGSVGEELGRHACCFRLVAGHVDHRVELAAVERGQVHRPVPGHGLQSREQARVGLTPVEQGDGVAATERGLYDGAAREPGAAQD
jgi:hypothetical protein